ncbi:MAG: hypothetical protein J0H55_14560 [Chitinophagaceae bacterium]|nr:hypothetical protein [Chitinophagaceae bacterium]
MKSVSIRIGILYFHQLIINDFLRLRSLVDFTRNDVGHGVLVKNDTLVFFNF